MSPSTAFAFAAEEVVEANFVQGGGRRVRRDVTADAVALAIGANHHRHRVPADEALDAALNFLASRKGRLLVDWECVLM